MFKTESIRHAWPEKAGFAINRPKGHWQYTFLHFFNSVEILAEGKLTKAPPHACILYRPGTPQYFISRQPLTHDWIHFSGDISGVPGLSEFQPDRLYFPPSPGSSVNARRSFSGHVRAVMSCLRSRQKNCLSAFQGRFREKMLLPSVSAQRNGSASCGARFFPHSDTDGRLKRWHVR